MVVTQATRTPTSTESESELQQANTNRLLCSDEMVGYVQCHLLEGPLIKDRPLDSLSRVDKNLLPSRNSGPNTNLCIDFHKSLKRCKLKIERDDIRCAMGIRESFFGNVRQM